MISKRYGLFSSGGSSGEEVLESVISYSSRLLTKDYGLLAIVSEFMNPPTMSIPTDELPVKICDWWKGTRVFPDEEVSGNRGRGLLFTNSIPVSASIYAERRAGDDGELQSWLQNLAAHNIDRVSPGLLYIKAEESNEALRIGDESKILDLDCRLVPKDKLGSIWTTYNYKAALYISKEWNKL